jgi:hypothetical protein
VSPDEFSTPTETEEEKVPRDGWGRPKVTVPGKTGLVAYTRVTTLVGSIEDTYNLSRWQQRNVARGMAVRRDLVMAAAAIGDPGDDKDKKAELQKIADAAQEAAQAKAAATIGTALHSFTERLERTGDPGVVPEEFQADITAYQEAMEDWEVLALEQFRVWDSIQVAGTADRLLRHRRTGEVVIGDVKTGQVDYGLTKIAMQLTCYAYGTPYTVKGGRAKFGDFPPASKERGLLIHLPAGQGVCTLSWLDLNEGLEGVKLARLVREWRKRKGLAVPYAT